MGEKQHEARQIKCKVVVQGDVRRVPWPGRGGTHARPRAVSLCAQDFHPTVRVSV